MAYLYSRLQWCLVGRQDYCCVGAVSSDVLNQANHVFGSLVIDNMIGMMTLQLPGL